MKMRETVMVLGGLIIGLALGVVMIGSNDSLRTSLFGAAGTTTVQMSYHLTDIQTLHDWLQPDTQLQAAFDQVSPLATATDFRQSVQSAQAAINTVIDQSYTRLFGTSAPSGTQVCLGLDDAPELPQTTLKLYVAVPITQASAVPTNWESLPNPKPDDLYWETIGCHS